MNFMHKAPGKVTLVSNAIHYKSYGCLMIAKNINETGRFNVRTSIRDVLFQKSFGDQRLGRSQFEFIQMFDYSCFYAETSHQSLVEFLQIYRARLLKS